MKKPLFFLLIAFLSVLVAQAQQTDSLMQSLERENQPEGAAIATFKSSRLILSQTTTMVKRKNLDFKVAHRFGDVGGVDGGSKILWGLDNSSDIYIDFQYGISDRVNIGFGRSKFEQLLDLSLKYAMVQQSADDKTPLSISLLSNIGFKPYSVATTKFDDYSNRFSYLEQAIISRKFSSRFSWQISPTILFRNLVIAPGDESTLFALGTAARYKFTKRFGIIADYYRIFSSFRDDNTSTPYYPPLGFGIEIETGGHVFTMNFVNAKAIVENNFIENTRSAWSKSQYRFGFTISRMFSFNKSEDKPAY
jgi:hypothetical protein